MRDAKQRLRPLDRIDPPDVWHRATRLEPLGDVPPGPGPSWQRRVAAGTVAFAVFAGVVALVLGAFGSDDVAPRPSPAGVGPGPAGAVRMTITVEDMQPVAAVEIDGRTVVPFGGSYCWSGGDRSICADTTEPTFEPDDIVAIEPGRPIVIEGSADRISANLLGYPYGTYEVLGRFPLDEGVGAFPTEEGRYILSVEATWPEGSRTFSLAFEIVATDDPAPSGVTGELAAIDVTSPTRDAEVSSPVTIAGTADVFEATVSIEIRDAVNNVIADDVTTATCGTGCRGDFSIEVPFSVGSPQSGTILVYEVSAMDGSRTNVVRIPVTLLPGEDDPVAAAIEGVWSDAEGNPLADGTDEEADFPLTMHVFEGPDHCGWTSVSFVHLAWPLGSVAEGGGDVRQYVRDPQGVLAEQMRQPATSDPFPDDAEPTGFHRNGWELWTAPSDVDRAVYGVQGDPRNGGAWERWPRAEPMILCA